jgi:hypothetical protein
MALARCRKCRKIASTAAKNCPHCGVKNPTRKPLSPYFKVAGAFAGTALLIGILESYGLRDSLGKAKIELPYFPTASTASAPAVQSRTEKREKHRFDVTTAVASTLKQSMDNPNSLVWETILADDDASIICLEYRVKDVRGEYSREYITYAYGRTSETPEDWNKHCAGKKLNDMIRVRDAV